MNDLWPWKKIMIFNPGFRDIINNEKNDHEYSFEQK